MARSNFVDIAQEAGVSYGQVCRLFATKSAILAGFGRQIDEALVDEVDIDLEEPARDRLFDVLMDRFELLDLIVTLSRRLRMIFAMTFQAFPACGTPPPPAWKRYSKQQQQPTCLRGVKSRV